MRVILVLLLVLLLVVPNESKVSPFKWRPLRGVTKLLLILELVTAWENVMM